MDSYKVKNLFVGDPESVRLDIAPDEAVKLARELDKALAYCKANVPTLPFPTMETLLEALRLAL